MPTVPRQELQGQGARPSLVTGNLPAQKNLLEAKPASRMGEQVTALGAGLYDIGEESRRRAEAEQRSTDAAFVQSGLNSLKGKASEYDIKFKEDNQFLPVDLGPKYREWSDNQIETIAQTLPQAARDDFKLNAQTWQEGQIKGIADFEALKKREGKTNVNKDNFTFTKNDITLAAKSADVDMMLASVSSYLSAEQAMFQNDPSLKARQIIEKDAFLQHFVTESVAANPYFFDDLKQHPEIKNLPSTFLKSEEKKARAEIDRLNKEGLQAKKDAAVLLEKDIKDSLQRFIDTGEGGLEVQAQIRKHDFLDPKNKKDYMGIYKIYEKVGFVLREDNFKFKPFNEQREILSRELKPTDSKNYSIKSDAYEMALRINSRNEAAFNDDSAGYVMNESAKRLELAGHSVEDNPAGLLEISADLQKGMGKAQPSVMPVSQVNKWREGYDVETPRNKVQKLAGLVSYDKFLPQVLRDLKLSTAHIAITDMAPNVAERALTYLEMKDTDFAISQDERKGIKADALSAFYDEDSIGGVYMELWRQTGNPMFSQMAKDLEEVSVRYSWGKGNAQEGMSELWGNQKYINDPAMVVGWFPASIGDDNLKAALNEKKTQLANEMAFKKDVIGENMFNEYIKDLQGDRGLFVPNPDGDGFDLFDTVSGTVVVDRFDQKVGFKFDEIGILQNDKSERDKREAEAAIKAAKEAIKNPEKPGIILGGGFEDQTPSVLDALDAQEAYEAEKLRRRKGGKAEKEYGLRADGTKKGPGFLGELKRPDGKVSTELSIGVEIDGKEIEIPTLVPTLTEKETKSLLNNGPVTKEIADKAVDHAMKRMAKGLSPFKGGGKTEKEKKVRGKIIKEDLSVIKNESKKPEDKVSFRQGSKDFKFKYDNSGKIKIKVDGEKAINKIKKDIDKHNESKSMVEQGKLPESIKKDIPKVLLPTIKRAMKIDIPSIKKDDGFKLSKSDSEAVTRVATTLNAQAGPIRVNILKKIYKEDPLLAEIIAGEMERLQLAKKE